MCDRTENFAKGLLSLSFMLIHPRGNFLVARGRCKSPQCELLIKRLHFINFPLFRRHGKFCSRSTSHTLKFSECFLLHFFTDLLLLQRGSRFSLGYVKISENFPRLSPKFKLSITWLPRRNSWEIVRGKFSPDFPIENPLTGTKISKVFSLPRDTKNRLNSKTHKTHLPTATKTVRNFPQHFPLSAPTPAQLLLPH